MVLAEPAQLEPWARCPWDATQINGEREHRELEEERKGERKEVLGGFRRHRGGPCSEGGDGAHVAQGR